MRPTSIWPLIFIALAVASCGSTVRGCARIASEVSTNAAVKQGGRGLKEIPVTHPDVPPGVSGDLFSTRPNASSTGRPISSSPIKDFSASGENSSSTGESSRDASEHHGVLEIGKHVGRDAAKHVGEEAAKHRDDNHGKNDDLSNTSGNRASQKFQFDPNFTISLPPVRSQ
jgi:hypothetical protein